MAKRPKRYLSRTEVAETIGVAPSTLSRYVLPEPDAMIGDIRGWLPTTITDWDRTRPSRLRAQANGERADRIT